LKHNNKPYRLALDIQYKNIDTTSKSYQDSLHKARNARTVIKNSINQNIDFYKIFCIKTLRSQFNDCKKYGTEIINRFSDLIVIGMGGSVLNPETLINLSLRTNSTGVKIHFLNHTDPIRLQGLLKKISLPGCAVLAISNSGQTIETNSLVGVMISAFKNQHIKDLGSRFFFITKPHSGIMANVARKISAPIISHMENISGRFSGLTNVSTLVAFIAGVDIDEYIDGAEKVLESFLQDRNNNDSSPLISAASIYSTKKPIIVNIGYLQQFAPFLEWYSQIISESLGKNGLGITPVRGLGPNDQHSMLQLFLDGPCDKIYSLFYVQNLDHELKTDSIAELEYIADKKLSDINSANFEATQYALEVKKHPLRIVKLKDLSSKTVGALVAHSMLEVITLGYMMNINPFNQPGVELIKSSSKNIIINNLN
jgi:glucose-6-phosphate isomerase